MRKLIIGLGIIGSVCSTFGRAAAPRNYEQQLNCAAAELFAYEKYEYQEARFPGGKAALSRLKKSMEKRIQMLRDNAPSAGRTALQVGEEVVDRKDAITSKIYSARDENAMEAAVQKQISSEAGGGLSGCK